MFLDFRSASVAIGACFFLFAGGLFVFQSRRTRRDGVSEWIAAQRGISAVPTFVHDGWSVVGAQPYEALAKLLLDHGVKRRA